MMTKGVLAMLMIIALNLAALIWWTECLIEQAQEQRQEQDMRNNK